MNRLKKYLQQNKSIIFIRLLFCSIHNSKTLSTHLGAANKYKVCTKYKSELSISVHAIEKGLSIGNCRIGFGKEKIISLLKEIYKYFILFNDLEFTKYSLCVIKSYIDFNINLGYKDESLIDLFQNITKKIPIEIFDKSETGILNMAAKDIDYNFDFELFSKNRFSIRDFGHTPIDKSKIFEAIEIAKKTPSACNRQPWRIHLFWDKTKDQVLQFQGGCMGFYQDIQCAILVTCDLQMYFINEINQSYVDGGLYAMSLIYALHSKRLATIPLTTGFKTRKSKKLFKLFNIPHHESLITFIGIGSYKECFKVAVSKRSSIESYIFQH